MAIKSETTIGDLPIGTKVQEVTLEKRRGVGVVRAHSEFEDGEKHVNVLFDYNGVKNSGRLPSWCAMYPYELEVIN